MEDFIKKRERICAACLLQADDICNSELYLNPETNKISYTKKDGYFRGCGCYLPSKRRNKSNHCPLKKW